MTLGPTHTSTQEWLVNTIESISNESGFSDRIQRVGWPEAVGCQPLDLHGALNIFSASCSVLKCEDQIVVVLIRSLVYLPIVNFKLANGPFSPDCLINISTMTPGPLP